MVMMKIEDAPFTEQEKAKIKAMGVIRADWGHPARTLEDPVAFFRETMEPFGDPEASDFASPRGPVALERVAESDDRSSGGDQPG